jgi:hypothetical protein
VKPKNLYRKAWGRGSHEHLRRRLQQQAEGTELSATTVPSGSPPHCSLGPWVGGGLSKAAIQQGRGSS